MASKNPTTNKPRYQQQFCSLHCIGIMPRTCFKQKIWRMTASLITAGLLIKCEVILKCRLSPPQSLDGVELVTCSLSFQISKLPLVPSPGELPPGICQVQKHIQTCIQHLYTATVHLGHSNMMALNGQYPQRRTHPWYPIQMLAGP